MSRDPELELRRKWAFRAHQCQVVLVKKPRERTSHVLMKALLWALYLPDYPQLTVETPAGDRYKPDVVALDEQGHPTFWGEAGHVGSAKVRALVRRYRSTHLALAKWRTPPAVTEALVRKALQGVERTAPIDIIGFPADSSERFIRGDGQVRVRLRDLAWVRLES